MIVSVGEAAHDHPFTAASDRSPTSWLVKCAVIGDSGRYAGFFSSFYIARSMLFWLHKMGCKCTCINIPLFAVGSDSHRFFFSHHRCCRCRRTLAVPRRSGFVAQGGGGREQFFHWPRLNLVNGPLKTKKKEWSTDNVPTVKANFLLAWLCLEKKKEADFVAGPISGLQDGARWRRPLYCAAALDWTQHLAQV